MRYANFFEEKCGKSLFCNGKEDLFELLALVIAGEEVLLVRDDGLAGEAVGLPFAVAVEDEGFDGFDVPGGYTGIGSGDEGGECALVGRHTEDGFLATEGLVELRGEHAVRAGIGEHQHDRTAADGVT